jgi:hypothetical protein
MGSKTRNAPYVCVLPGLGLTEPLAPIEYDLAVLRSGVGDAGERDRQGGG